MPQTNLHSKPHFSILATSFAGGPPPRRTATIVFGLWFLLFFPALFSPPLLDDADATHAQAARAMATTGDLVTLRVDGIRYLEKAPLPYWLAAASFKLFGFNTFAAHLPQALAVLLLALLGYRWANQAFGSRTGFYTALGVLTSTGVFLFTRILIPEVLLALSLGAALFAFLKCLGPIAPDIAAPFAFRRHPEQSEGPPHPIAPDVAPSLAFRRHPERSEGLPHSAHGANQPVERYPSEPPHYANGANQPVERYPSEPPLSGSAQSSAKPVEPLERPSVAWYAGPLFYPYVMWASLALAVLSKGLVALIFFFATTLAFLLLTGETAKWRLLRPFTGLVLFLAIAAPWHILAGLRNQVGAGGHGFWWFYFWNEHVLRFLGRRTPADFNRMPGYLYWLSHLLWLFPWTLFLPLGITALHRRQQHQELLTTQALGAPSFPALPERVGYRAHGSTALLEPATNPGAPGLASETWAGPAQNPIGNIPKLHLLLGLIMMSTIYPIIKITGVDPISLLLLEGVASLVLIFAIQRRRASLTPSPFHRIDPQQRTLLLLALFAAIVLLFFSVSTNQEYYTFPAYLPLLLLIAATITRAEQTYSTNPSAVRWVTFAHTAFLVLGWTAAAALLYGLIASAHLPYNPDLGTVLAHRGIGSYTLATSHLFDLTTAAFAGLRLPAILAAVALTLGPAAAWGLRTQRRHLAATTTIAFTAAAFLVAAHLAFARFAPILSSRDFANVIEQYPPDIPVLLFGDQSFGSSIPFYLGRSVYLVDGRSTSMLFGSTFPDDAATHTFLTQAEFLHAWSNPNRLLLFIPAERRDEALHLLPPNPTILKEESGKLLLLNHP